MKKFFPVLLSLILSMGISGFAAGNGKFRLSEKHHTNKLLLTKSHSEGFCINFEMDLSKVGIEQELASIDQLLDVRYRLHNPNERNGQNYPAYKMSDGSVPVVECRLQLLPLYQSPERNILTVGVPLAMLTEPYGKHLLTIVYDKVKFSLYVDGELVDNDFSLGEIDYENVSSWRINPKVVKNAFLSSQTQCPKTENKIPYQISNAQYWTPPFFNAWVGDVVTAWFKGRYHVFYLFDRRGHGSKLGKGGHYFEHISTDDFHQWTVHKPAVPIEQQWETIGTGTPFVYKDKLYLTYGLHTTRIYPREQTTLPMQADALEKNGSSLSINIDSLQEGIHAAGATYSVSEDGENFQKSNILFHPCENPSVYITPDGQLRMLANYGAKGTWASDSLNGGWTCIDKDFPPGGDCTFYFRYGNYDYIIGGFNNLWFKHKDEREDKYQSATDLGMDFYNGLSVPAITQIPDGRWLTAGWVSRGHWGGALVVHELVQHKDGRLCTRWMKEMMPSTSKSETISGNQSKVEHEKFMLSFDVNPTNENEETIDVELLPAEGENDACTFRLNLNQKRASYTGWGKDAHEEKTIREGGTPSSATNYAVEGGFTTDKTITVRMIVWGDEKLGGSLLDTEINEERSILSYRKGLKVGRISVHSNTSAISNIRVSAIQH